MQKNILIGIICLALLGCEKVEKEDLSGEIELKGTIFINDTIRNNTGEILLTNQPVQIKYPSQANSNEYIYQVNSSALGSFTFTNLKEINYQLFSQKEQADLNFTYNKLITAAELRIPQKIVLYPDFSKHNFLSITVRDSATKGLLTGAKVCIFSSRLVAT